MLEGVQFLVEENVFKFIDMIKKIIFVVILITTFSCAPHGHLYKIIDNSTISPFTEIRVLCLPKDKIFMIDNELKDTVVLCFDKIGNKCAQILSADSIINMPHYKLKISDIKFHRKFKSDTLKIKIQKEGGWDILKFQAVQENYEH